MRAHVGMNDADLTIVCDGGSLGNPGKGYGSFRLTDRHGHNEITRLEFGPNMTNNQAEYRTLIAALEQALAHASDQQQQPANLRLQVLTDSQLLVEQVLGRWKVRNAGLQPLNARARELLAAFGSREVVWQPRAKTVRVLGH